MQDKSIHEQMEEMRAEIRSLCFGVRSLHALIEERLPAAPRPLEERPEDLVGVEFVARLFGCTESSARDGKAGTGDIPWIPGMRPKKCRRADVYAALRRKTEGATTPQQRALKLLDRSGARRKRPPRAG